MPIVTTPENKGAFPDQSFIPAAQAIPDALILQHATQGPAVTGDAPLMRIPYVGDIDADITAEGAAIAETTPPLSELTVSTKKLALLTVLSNESVATDGVEPLFTDALRRGITRKADALFLANTPTITEGGATTEPAGIAATPGIIQGGAITGTTGLSPLLALLGTLGDNGAAPSAIITGHGTWAKLLQLTDANGRPIVAPDVANAPAPALYGIPVTLNAQAPANTIVVIDRNEVLASCSPVTIATSTERYFDRDSTAVRITFRAGFGILHPNRCGIVTVGDGKTTGDDGK